MCDDRAMTSVTSRVSIGLNTAPQRVDWQTLDAVWARVGELDVFQSVWLNDHLSDVSRDRGGPSLESLTTLAALIHRVPGRLVGHGVLSTTFRHPAVLAKAATVLDHATGGHFVLGLGAGWHPGEHLPFAIPLPPMPERFDRFESAVETIHAMFSPAAASPQGVTRSDLYFPLDGATNEPPPLTPGGPPIWLGGQKRRGIALAARLAQGWVLPALVPGDPVDYFRDRREAVLAEIERIGRPAHGFVFAAKVAAWRDLDPRDSVRVGLGFVEVGATHLLLMIEPGLGVAEVDRVAERIARPLREALG
jgi:alkanesulfonate monooxygenase SsuD/methylene tetrahydromethanopterin reductase-like flavin-dependent oxidoreductase (luciferase family)